MREDVITLMAFSDSGWMRRLRVPRQLVVTLAAIQVGLTVASLLLGAYAVWAHPHLRRLGAVERENRSLTVQLEQQVSRVKGLQHEMSRIRQLEESLRSLSGIPGRTGGTEERGQDKRLVLPAGP